MTRPGFPHTRHLVVKQISALVLLLAAVSPGPAGAQENADLDAATILARAAKAQSKNGSPADEDLALEAALLIQTRNPDGQDVTLEVKRAFLSPYYIKTRVRDGFSGTETVVGFDGELGWYSKAGKVQLLEGPDFENDRRRLQQDIETTSLFVNMFFLSSLQKKLTDLERLPDESGFGMTAYVLGGKGDYQPPDPGSPKEKVLLKLWIDQASQKFLGARVTFADPTKRPMQFCFTAHETDKNGITLPGRIEVFYGSDDKPTTSISVIEINFSTKLTPESFRRPE